MTEKGRELADRAIMEYKRGSINRRTRNDILRSLVLSGDITEYECHVIIVTNWEVMKFVPNSDPPEDHAHPLNDNIYHPSHYTSYKGIEVIQLTEQMNFNRGNAVKYIARAGLKRPETEIEDLCKARWYIDREIVRLGGKSCLESNSSNTN